MIADPLPACFALPLSLPLSLYLYLYLYLSLYLSLCLVLSFSLSFCARLMNSHPTVQGGGGVPAERQGRPVLPTRGAALPQP